MKILLEVKNVCEKKVELIEVEYNYETTIEKLLDENIMEMPKALSLECFNPMEKVDFYYHEGVLFWDININKMLVVDFVNKFPNFKCKIPVWVNFGGLGSAPREIVEFSIELYNRVNQFIVENPLAVMLIGFTINSCKKQVKKWIDTKKNCVKFSSFKNSLYEKTKWQLEDVEKALEIDIKSAKVIMRVMGYKYNKKTKIFTLNKRIDE